MLKKLSKVISSLAFALLVFAPVAGTCYADVPPEAVVPISDDVVLERLPRSYANFHAVPAAALSPQQLMDLIEKGAASGDARMLGMAEAALKQSASTLSASEQALARSWLMQHRHDFAGALRVLNELSATQPSANALSARAQILLVQGDLNAVQRDCSSLLVIDQSQAMLCAANLAARRGNGNGASLLFERWLQANRDPSALRRAVLVRAAELACAQREFAACELRFKQALMLNPSDVRTLAARARTLRAQSRFPEVLDVLEPEPAADTLLLERLLAANALNAAETSTLSDKLSARYALMRARAEVPELREEAEFELLILRNPQRALALAEANFVAQRDFEDADLLTRAARAAESSQSLQMLDNWQREQGINAVLAPVN